MTSTTSDDDSSKLEVGLDKVEVSEVVIIKDPKVVEKMKQLKADESEIKIVIEF